MNTAKTLQYKIPADEIRGPIKKELKVFDSYFKDAMRSQVPLLDHVMRYIISRKGKQVRPMFVLLSAKLHGMATEKTYLSATLIELLHTATLVHDDVVDDANERRGFFSIEQDAIDMLRITSRAVKEMSEGELLQIEKARRLDIEEPVYYEIIRKKTASLIAAACACGAASTSGSDETVEKMWRFGEKAGIAFQIKDDLLDYSSVDIGKPKGIDIKEKKMTLPLIYALNNASWSKRRRIINIIKNNNKETKKIIEVMIFVKESGGIEYTEKAMNKFRDEALDILNEYPEDEIVKSLKQLVLFTTERKK